MSGIGGIVQLNSKPKIGRIRHMASLLAVSGERQIAPAQLGFAAMAVAQAWPYQELQLDSGLLISADADLSNFQNLAEKVGLRSVEIDPSAVTRVIARLYLAQGIDFVNSLEGTFALAVWDQQNQRLVLAIDSFSAKSLYWSIDGDALLFASRAGAVAAAHSQPLAVDESALVQFLIFSAVLAPTSIYRGIQRLEPGHVLVYENAQAKLRRYWDVDYIETRGKSEKYWIEETREGIRSAVHRTLGGCSNEGTGAYLSGGTDSSSVVAFMSEKYSPVNTFSIAFSESRYNEIGYARTTASKFHARHHEYVVTPQDAIDALPKIAAYYDEPFANSSAIGGYYCAKMAREQGVDVMLAGDGGDEIFAGNERYATDKRFQLYQSIPAFFRKGLIEPAVRQLPKNGALSLPGRYIRRANIPNPRRVISYGVFLSDEPETIFDAEFLGQAPPDMWLETAEKHHHTGSRRSELNRMMYTDVKITLGDNDLRKVTGTAEMAGITVRYPLLDRRLVELSARIPSSFKMRGFKKRYIFKQAMREILPQEVLHKTKHGFGVPVALWLLQNPKLRELTYDLLNDRRTRQRGYLQPSFLDRILQLHKTGHTAYYGEVIWYLLVLEMWHREHLEKIREVTCAG